MYLAMLYIYISPAMWSIKGVYIMPFLFKNYSVDSYGAAGLVAINPGGGRLFFAFLRAIGPPGIVDKARGLVWRSVARGVFFKNLCRDCCASVTSAGYVAQ